jgi:hypothetical protein
VRYFRTVSASALALIGLVSGQAMATWTVNACYALGSVGASGTTYVTLQARNLGRIVPTNVVGQSQGAIGNIPQQVLYSLSGKANQESGFATQFWTFSTLTGTAVVGLPAKGVIMNFAGANGINGLQNSNLQPDDFVSSASTACRSSGGGGVFPQELVCRTLALGKNIGDNNVDKSIAAEFTLTKVDRSKVSECSRFFVPENPDD